MSEIIPAGAAIASAVSIAPQASATLPAAETTAVPDPAPEPHRNPAVQRCLQARSQRIQAERRKRGSSEYEAEGCGGEAYRCAMPDLSGLQSSIGSLQSSIGTLQTQVKQAFEGTAIAIATAGTQLPSDKNFAISATYGYVRGENAVSLGAALRLTDWAVASFAVGGGVQQHGYGGRAGLTLAW